MITETITSTPNTATVIITPETARTWLLANNNNRPVSRITVEKYKRDMLAGLWHYTNAGIAFDLNGDMIDGQHRLLAISELPEGNGIAMNVTRGLAPEARYYIDQGRKRTPGNQLAMAGVKNYNHNAAGARFYIIWTSGVIFRDSKQSQLITSPQIQDWVDHNADLIEKANAIHRDLVKNDATPAVSRAAFFAFVQIDPEAATKFFRSLSTGAGLNEGDPILTLRQRLETDRRTRRNRSSREQLGMLILAWNAWRANRKLGSIAVKTWDASNFPVPK